MGIEDIVTPGVLEERFQVGAVIGQGGYSVVRLAVEKSTGLKVAVKFIEKKRAFGDMDLDSECRLLRKLGRHPNINGFLGLYANEKYFMIVLEYMQGGELLDILIKRIESNAAAYSEAQVAVIMRQIMGAVEHCHKNDIIHRDLKPENILVGDEDMLGCVHSLFEAPLKLADFGLACVLPEGKKLTPTCGTPNYMSPERLCKKPYDTASDIWSTGVIMYILLTGTFPFYGDTEQDIRACACDPNEPEYGEEFANISRPCLDLLKNKMLNKDPKKRISATEVLAHPWMTGELASTADLSGALKQLKRFNARRKFRAAVKALVASNRLQTLLQGLYSDQLAYQLSEFGISVQAVKDLGKAFDTETKNTGFCDRETFIRVVAKELGIPKQSLIEQLFESIKDKDSMANTRDFCLSLATKVGTTDTEILGICFDLYDADGSGIIDQQEYTNMVRSILKSLGDSFAPNDLWLQQEFEIADEDHNQSISLQEFIVVAKTNVKIQRYLRNMESMIRVHKKEEIKDIESNLGGRCGEIYLKKDAFFNSWQGWKERYAAVDNMSLVLHKTENDYKNKAEPYAIFDLTGATINANIEMSKRSSTMGHIKIQLNQGKFLFMAKTLDCLK
eukprot:Ihof_evm12s104 gene=Ihof_evmTU12s104